MRNNSFQNRCSHNVNIGLNEHSRHGPQHNIYPQWGQHQSLQQINPSQLSSFQSCSHSLPGETSVDIETLNEIKRKSELYETAKERITTKIKRDFKDIIEKIREAENKVLEDARIELEENPFSTLLAKIHSGNAPPDIEIENVLSKEIPQVLGPSKESFQKFYKEIKSFKAWQEKKDDKIKSIIMLSDCSWKECPANVNDENKYSVDKNNPRVASKNDEDKYSTIIGNTPLPLNKVISWNIKLLKSRRNNGSGIYAGIASFNIKQNESKNYEKCGWYFNYYLSKLWSGPPHNYRGKEYGPRKKFGEYVRTGDRVGVFMDTTKGELSFVLNGVNFGVAYEGISLDKPLVPCVLLYHKNDSIELDLSEMKENVDKSIPTPSNIIANSDTWDSATITWDAVEGASFYQIEVDGSKSWDATMKTKFTKSRFLPETEHSFRVRTVKNNSVSKWSGVVKGKTLKAQNFSECIWKECPGNINEERKYTIDVNNPRVAAIIGSYCTVIGNTPLPHSATSLWNIKILNSKKNDGGGIFIGIVPFDLDQNMKGYTYVTDGGWYFSCYDSLLYSGPPHNIRRKAYGPRRKNGEYVHTGDSVGVIMYTIKGELSFVLDGVNCGVAFEGIPLDKPLVPCVVLKSKGDSVELVLSSDSKENGDYINVPSSITVKSTTLDSITITWDIVEGALYYQVEVDKNKKWNSSAANVFTKNGLLEETEHSFRVRAVRGYEVSEWSTIVKGKTLKWECIWKKCPVDVNCERKYSVDENNPRIAAKIDENDKWSTITGNTVFLLNRVVSWSIKILQSKGDNGSGILIGVAPFDIGQNDDNYNKCGWYFNCYLSTLWSGPPHNYNEKEYGLKKDGGSYVHTGDVVGVVMDTTRGNLSISLSGVNCGVAFEGIPLDKPLVPCVLLWYKDISVELDTSEVKENTNSSVPVPSNIIAKSTTWDSITFTWDAVDGVSYYQIEIDGNKSWDALTTNSFTKRGLLEETEHSFRVRTVKDNKVSEWSDVVKGKTLKWECIWKKCPVDVNCERKYSIDKNNPRIAAKIDENDKWPTIIGNTPLPPNKVISWSIKILQSKGDNGSGILIGVAPFDIDQNDDNYNKCGWYFNCYLSTLWSGPPHNYNEKEYGLKKDGGSYVHTGDVVGVVMDTTKGELSFVLNRVSYGVAFEGIPLDKPLVPCVLLWYKDISVELDTSEVEENTNSSVPVPSNIIAKSTTWDSITLTWDTVDGAEFYQIEIDGNKSWYVSTTNAFTKRGLIPNTEHNFRARTVKKTKVGEWSNVVKGRTQEKITEYSWWKECPDDVEEEYKYSIDKNNPRIASHNGYGGYYPTIVGNTPLPSNKVTSWNIKILKSRRNNGDGIFIGVAPFDISQDEDKNYEKCGWYFYCYQSALFSCLPHKYISKKYGLKKGNGKYIHTGDSIGVVMNTTKKSELSFILNNVNLGVAYEGIPLDKPLVPCVLLFFKGDSVELDTSGMKENMDKSIPTPFNIIAKSDTWDSATITWDAVENADFYQIEVDGNRSWDATMKTKFTKSRFLPETEHSFRVRTVKGGSVNEWSNNVKIKTNEKPWEELCVWKKCPDDVDYKRKYHIDIKDPRIATKAIILFYIKSCTIVGNVNLPLNKVTSWNIKILKSKRNDGEGIYIGVAPSDINQNEDGNHKKCGWYFCCYDSKLYSGPPHNYKWKEYGPRKEDGEYVHTGDSVGVMMDTAKGELSFALNGVNYGVAYEGIPLDNPLVSCVLLETNGDSIELDTSDVKECVDCSILVPSNITAKSVTWNSITLSWNIVYKASFYQIEINGEKSWDTSKTNAFIRRMLSPDTEHSFRVRTVKDNSVSEWSDVVKWKTLEKPWEELCVWKKCPDNIPKKRKYSIDMINPKIVKKVCSGYIDDYCTVIGNLPLPFNKVTSWKIKIVKSINNISFCIYIGVAPSDINQNEDGCNFNKCGWYFNCCDSRLWSGPPHNYAGKAYGPRKDEEYVHTGDSVGVVTDMIEGKLSFVLSGINLGTAFERIPLDKPLVPCVILRWKDDSIEFDTSGVKENEADKSIPVPSNITKIITWNSITLTWNDVESASFYQIEVDGVNSGDATTKTKFTKIKLLAETEHYFRVRTVKDNSVSEWSNTVKGRTTKRPFETSEWKECPDGVDGKMKYSVGVNNPVIATNTGDDFCTIIGNAPLPLNKITSWSIKILKSKWNDGESIYIGVAPFDINQNEHYNYEKCGWYFGCYDSTLCSGPPHNYDYKEYGPRKKYYGDYVRTGDSVGVVMDTVKGELSFVLNGVNLGVAYEGIPLDKPLVPCVILGNIRDSVKLDTSEVKENEVDNSIPVPSNIVIKSISWDSIILSWKRVRGISFYQIETDGIILGDAFTSNMFAKGGFRPKTEHTFRVRIVKGNSVGEWSNIVKGRTQKKLFETSGWKECPGHVERKKRYSVDEKNTRVATKVNDEYCTIIGNTLLPLNEVTSWNIKILKSKENDGDGIFAGVAPFDINQNGYDNYEGCGWYFNCYDSTLCSGPPHNYRDKDYGPRKKDGEYVYTGDSVGVVMDTTKGDLLFVLNGVNCGVAYERIPLNKPLVPCVILGDKKDSIELDLSEVKENASRSVPIPPNIIAKSTTWDSITFTWNAVDGASFYQIEIDGNESWNASTTNTLTKRGLLPNTVHSFRVRTVKKTQVGEWSNVVKGRTQCKSFEVSRWKKCPNNVYWRREYSVDESNLRVATKTDNGDGWCTIIGNTPLPPNKVTSWSIKILKSRKNNGDDIFIGIAPSDINQNEDSNFNKCGWYFNCYQSTLYSGPPHNYKSKEYGVRKDNGKYVHTGDSVGVVMDTTRGNLSISLSGVNCGVAFEGIPLDKPLVPCVLLKYEGDSVKLVLPSKMTKNGVDKSIIVPPNITTESITWDSITLRWDDVEGASFYQIEVDGIKSWDATTTNTFTKRGLFAETEHSFKVRTVKRNLVSEWSDVVQLRTKKAPKIVRYAWKECPEYIINRKYSIDEDNPRIATKINNSDGCTIIGNAPLPLNKVTSWNIKILKSMRNDGEGIYIGVAPSDINQNEDCNHKKRGWYFCCYDSKLYSGPPHNYDRKEYGPKKWIWWDGRYVCTKNNVSVLMDTTKDELSFALNGVNYGVAFKRIILDKPLVICVILKKKGDSIKLL